MDKSLKIVYLLEDTPLFGGVKVVLRQADLLARRGHQVTVASPGQPPSWMPIAAEFRRTASLAPEELPSADVTVASYWTTIRHALAVPQGEAVHYCQGFEGSYTHNVTEHDAIDQAYKASIPAMVVAPHLRRFLEGRYGRPARVVPQPLESFWRPQRRRRPHRTPRILVMSPFEIDWKGVATSLRAIRELQNSGFQCEVVRLSQWPLTEAELAILAPDEFHEHLPPHRVPEIVAGCDLLLAASWEQEGFGLPVLEAMASGVPVVASDIACFRDFATEAARLVPFDQPKAFATAAREILENPESWRRMRRAGRTVARDYRETHSAQVAEGVLRWVASGSWREDLRRIRDLSTDA